MTIDLAALEDPTLAGYVQSIPLNVDPFPYADLQAQGRYPIQSTPDTIPQMLAYLAGVDAESGQGGRVGYINSDHRLLVDAGSGGASALAPQPWKSVGGQPFTFGAAANDDTFVQIVTASSYLMGVFLSFRPSGAPVAGVQAQIEFDMTTAGAINNPFVTVGLFMIDQTNAPLSLVQSHLTMFPVPNDQSKVNLQFLHVANNSNQPFVVTAKAVFTP